MKYFFTELESLSLPSLFRTILIIVPFLHVFTAIGIMMYLIQAAPPGQQYNSAATHDLYVNTIRQGMNGSWKTALPYTTLSQPPVFGYYMYFIFLGQLNRIFRIEPVLFYHLAEIGTGLLLLGVSFIAVKKLFPPTLAAVSFFLIHFLETGIYYPSLFRGLEGWVPSFVYQQELIERHFGLPHHTFAKAMGFLFVMLFLTYGKKRSFKHIAALIGAAIATTLIMPPVMIVAMAAVIVPYMGLRLLDRSMRPLILPFVSVSGFIGGTLLLLKQQMSLVPELAIYSVREKTWWDPNETIIRYASSLMFYYPFLLLALIGIVLSWKTLSKNTKHVIILLWSWLLLPGLLIPVSSLSFFPIAGTRLVDGYQYFPAGVLSAIGILLILSVIKQKWVHHVVILMSIVVVALSTCVSLVLINSHLKAYSYPWWNIYPTTGYWEATKFIQTLPAGTGLLIEDNLGEILPSQALVKVYVAAPGATWPFYDERKNKMIEFYKGWLSDQAAATFLKENNIEYVYYGVKEAQIKEAPTLYPMILKPVYNKEGIIIYKIN